MLWGAGDASLPGSGVGPTERTGAMSVSQLARSIKASPTLKLNETAAKLEKPKTS